MYITTTSGTSLGPGYSLTVTARVKASELVASRLGDGAYFSGVRNNLENYLLEELRQSFLRTATCVQSRIANTDEIEVSLSLRVEEFVTSDGKKGFGFVCQ